MEIPIFSKNVKIILFIIIILFIKFCFKNNKDKENKYLIKNTYINQKNISNDKIGKEYYNNNNSFLYTNNKNKKNILTISKERKNILHNNYNISNLQSQYFLFNNKPESIFKSFFCFAKRRLNI